LIAQPRATRYALRLPVAYRRAGATAWVAGTTENVSHSGVLFTGVTALPAGALVEMRLALPGPADAQGSEVACLGRVVRQGSATRDGTLLAVAIGNYRLTRREEAPRAP
jgi:hypothetical protein